MLFLIIFYILGSIYDLIQKNGTIPEVNIARFVKQIVSALCHLQDLKIVHRYTNNPFHYYKRANTNLLFHYFYYFL